MAAWQQRGEEGMYLRVDVVRYFHVGNYVENDEVRVRWGENGVVCCKC